MMNKKMCFLGVAMLGAMSLVLRAQDADTATSSPAPKAAPVHQAAQQPSEGERVFAQNCSRCHTTPDGFSPRISGTIAMHMRVRASLSKHDTQELMRFLNP
jgi:mono/diheme cytochrome c family protein